MILDILLNNTYSLTSFQNKELTLSLLLLELGQAIFSPLVTLLVNSMNTNGGKFLKGSILQISNPSSNYFVIQFCGCGDYAIIILRIQFSQFSNQL